MLQIEHHDSHESSWFVHNGRVYDATAFLKDHPGGAESILIVAGQDATDEFNAIHSAKAKAMLNDYLIGKVAPAGSIAPAAQAPQEVSGLPTFPSFPSSSYFFLLFVGMHHTAAAWAFCIVSCWVLHELTSQVLLPEHLVCRCYS